MTTKNGTDPTLRKLVVDERADSYSARKHLLRGLPNKALAYTHEELRDAFEAHMESSTGEVSRTGEHAVLRDGLANDAATDVDDAPAQGRAGHHETSRYGCLDTWAEQLSWHDVPMLQEGTPGGNERTDGRPGNIEGSVNGSARKRKEQNWWKRMGKTVRTSSHGSYRIMGAPVRKPRRTATQGARPSCPTDMAAASADQCHLAHRTPTRSRTFNDITANDITA